MSIFDVDDNIDNGIEYDVAGPKRKSVIQYNYENVPEKVNYCEQLSKVDVYCHPYISGLPLFYEIRHRIKVVFSGYRRTYKDKSDDPSLKDILVLGEYVPSHPDFGECVIIYINNIQESCTPQIDFDTLMLATYIHELYHAYFRSNLDVALDIEESLAEFGSLFCLEAMATMGVINMNYVKSYLSEVENKKTKLPHYSFGAYIYDKHRRKIDWGLGQLLDSYRDKVQNSDLTDLMNFQLNDVDNWGDAYDKLCKALNYVD